MRVPAYIDLSLLVPDRQQASHRDRDLSRRLVRERHYRFVIQLPNPYLTSDACVRCLAVPRPGASGRADEHRALYLYLVVAETSKALDIFVFKLGKRSQEPVFEMDDLDGDSHMLSWKTRMKIKATRFAWKAKQALD